MGQGETRAAAPEAAPQLPDAFRDIQHAFIASTRRYSPHNRSLCRYFKSCPLVALWCAHPVHVHQHKARGAAQQQGQGQGQEGQAQGQGQGQGQRQGQAQAQGQGQAQLQAQAQGQRQAHGRGYGQGGQAAGRGAGAVSGQASQPNTAVSSMRGLGEAGSEVGGLSSTRQPGAVPSPTPIGCIPGQPVEGCTPQLRRVRPRTSAAVAPALSAAMAQPVLVGEVSGDFSCQLASGAAVTEPAAAAFPAGQNAGVYGELASPDASPPPQVEQAAGQVGTLHSNLSAADAGLAGAATGGTILSDLRAAGAGLADAAPDATPGYVGRHAGSAEAVPPTGLGERSRSAPAFRGAGTLAVGGEVVASAGALGSLQGWPMLAAFQQQWVSAAAGMHACAGQGRAGQRSLRYQQRVLRH